MYSDNGPSSTTTTKFMVLKRDNKTVVEFDSEKIKKVIEKALLASGESQDDIIKISALATCKTIALVTGQRNLFALDAPINIEDIQNAAELTLMEMGLYTAAKKFIIYRQNRSESRQLAQEHLIGHIEEYFGKAAWDIKENSNMDYSLQGLNNFVTSKVMKTYWMNKVYSPDIKEAHESGSFHIHDASLLSCYCMGWDLRDLLMVGFGGVAGTNTSGPAKHFDAILGQIWNFLYSLQGESAGAQAFSNFDTYLAPFIYYDKLSYKEVKQSFQKFFHNMTTKTRVGFQSPFTNVSLDLYVPLHMKNEPAIIAGQLMDKSYGEFQNEMNILNKAFCEVMIEGDSEGRQFSFPIPNYNISKDFDWENPNLEPLWKLTGKYGAPYFTNFVNSDLSPEDVRSMCPFHPDEKISIRLNGNYVIMRIEDIYKNLAFKTLDKVFVKYKNEDIHVTGVTKHVSTGFVRIYTDADPQGITVDKLHMQPYRICKYDEKHNVTWSNLLVTEAYKLPTVDCYVPYSKPENSIYCHPDSITIDDLCWIPLRGKENMGRMTLHSYCITVDSNEHLFEMGPGRLVTHNCRLQLDNRVLRKRGGGLFGANPLTGSAGVVTLNLPKLAYENKNDKEKFFKALVAKMDLAVKSLLIKRKFIEQKCDEGLYPFSRFYMRSTKERFGEYYFNHFSTIGIVGGDECALNFFGKSIVEQEGLDFMIEVLDFMRARMLEYQDKYGYPFNLEATPAESVSYRLAKLDKERYPDIISATSGIDGAEPYYTNSTQLPVNYTSDIFEACEHQDQLQTKYTGGTVLHLFLGEEIKDTNVVKSLIRKVCENYHVPYVTLSPKYSVCASHGYLAGEQPVCPSCGNESEVYARVVGFYTPVNRMNVGKKEEMKIRKNLDPDSILHREWWKK